MCIACSEYGCGLWKIALPMLMHLLLDQTKCFMFFCLAVELLNCYDK